MVLCFPLKQYFSRTEPNIEPGTFIHLVRHGEAYHNLGHFNRKANLNSYNIQDPRLTRKGVEQAKSAREQMTKRCPAPNLVLISPLTRTLETTLHIFPFDDNFSIFPQPQIVAYDDLRESGAYLCNVRRTTLDLTNDYDHKGVDFTALSPIAPPNEEYYPCEKARGNRSEANFGHFKAYQKGRWDLERGLHTGHWTEYSTTAAD